jgi:hypothetical protein
MEERVKMIEEIQHKIYIQRWETKDKKSIKVDLNFKEAEFLFSAVRSAIIWETTIGTFVEDEEKIETRYNMLKKLEQKHFKQQQESKDNSITFDFNDKEWEFLSSAVSAIHVWEERIEHFIDKKNDEA